MKKYALILGLLFLLMVSGCAATEPSPDMAPELTLPEPTPTDMPTEVPASPSPEPTEPIRYYFNESYVLEGSKDQKLDIYLPESGTKPFPTILAFHGGAFRSGPGLPDKSLYAPFARHFNELGYALVSADYRLAPRSTYPAQVKDVFCALGWIHANGADFGLDSERLIIMGDSAGGYLAAMLGTVETPEAYMQDCPFSLPEDNWFDGVVVYYGFFDFTNIDDYAPGEISFGFEPYWGSIWEEIPAERLAEMSPMSWVDGSEAPFLLIHGTQDQGIPSSLTEAFAATLQDVGVPATVVLIESGHGFLLEPPSSEANTQAFEAIDLFLSDLIPD